MQNGWRSLNINPLLVDPANPNGARIRPLAADLQRVYGDPRLLGIVNILESIDRSLYDEVATHFEHRFSARAGFQVNYTLAWGRGIGGVADGTTRTAPPSPQIASVSGGDYNAPWEWGPTAFDERHRVTIAGNLALPFGIDASPSMTAATARPYTQYRATNPSGDGSLQLLCSSGNSNDVGFGVGQVPCGVDNARGFPLFNANMRLTKNHLSRSREARSFCRVLQPDQSRELRKHHRRQPVCADDVQQADRVSGRNRCGLDHPELVPGPVRRPLLVLAESRPGRKVVSFPASPHNPIR